MSVCKATLRIAAFNEPPAVYACDLEAPHTGLAHTNEEARAHWCSHGEAVTAEKKSKAVDE